MPEPLTHHQLLNHIAQSHVDTETVRAVRILTTSLWMGGWLTGPQKDLATSVLADVLIAVTNRRADLRHQLEGIIDAAAKG